MNKDSYILQLENRIKDLEKSSKDEYIAQLEGTIDKLQKQLDNLTEMILLMRKQKFGSSSEKTPDTVEQLNFFNEAEAEFSPSAEELIVKRGNDYILRKPKSRREQILKDLPVREVMCTAHKDDLFCEQCNGELRSMGTEVVREELEYIPAKLQIVRYIRKSYECPACKHTDHPFIFKAFSPRSLMNHSLASPSSVANVMYQKYVNAMPLYRQEKDWERLGIGLTRATMANWVIRCSEEYFSPLIQHLHSEMLKRDIISCDESPMQVLKEDGKTPQSKSYMWLYRTSDDGAPIVLYDYQSSRNGDHAETYLKGFRGYLVCDGYSGYNKLEGVTRCGCLAHLRRKFIEAIPSKQKSGSPLTNAEIGRDYCNQLFSIEEKIAELTSAEKYEKRLGLEKPVLEAFWSWLESLSVLRGSALAKAVTYAVNQREYLGNYLLDGRIPISNNSAENSIRPFAVGRKNWLFADTPKGATASAAVYSLVETAKANDLNVFSYLEYLLQYLPNMDYLSEPELLDDLMPWSNAVKHICKK